MFRILNFLYMMKMLKNKNYIYWCNNATNATKIRKSCRPYHKLEVCKSWNSGLTLSIKSCKLQLIGAS